MIPSADNYNSAATTDDGSCTPSWQYECNDASALNYNASAVTDDGCLYTDSVRVNVTVNAVGGWTSNVHIAGGMTVWTHEPMTNIGGTEYSRVFHLPEGTYEYKATTGSWNGQDCSSNQSFTTAAPSPTGSTMDVYLNYESTRNCY